MRPGLWEGARKGWKGSAFCGCAGWVAGVVLPFCGWGDVLPPPLVLSLFVLSSGNSPWPLR